MEYKILKEIITSVESSYVTNIPLHHLPSARSIHYDGNGSQIFVTTAENFRSLKPHVIHEIFKQRHILILDAKEDEKISFDSYGLSLLGDLDVTRQIQGTQLYFPSHSCDSRRLQCHICFK